MNAGRTGNISVAVTNEGAGSQTVTPTLSGRPTTLSNDTGSVTLSSSSPTSSTAKGTPLPTPAHVQRPGRAGNLNGNITWNAQNYRRRGLRDAVRPAGNVAAYSLIGSDQSGFGHVEVHDPIPGTWTAVDLHGHTAPYFGPVKFSYHDPAVPPGGLGIAVGPHAQARADAGSR